MGIIKTPDQRVRVFISSTINELAEERQAAREAISNLRLTPVFFEAGARPHPPRDLYSAYLDQSHIFVGIYWNSYGWIAPGSEISGLEDEYRLCGKKPKLIYVKASTSRQDKLNDLLSDIQRSDSACYQKFETAEELRVLLENDLSVLMSETFENAMFSSQDTDRSNIKQVMARKVELPAVRGAIIGREDDLQQLQELAKSDDVRVITILGAGGTGKTTVAISLAHMVQGDYKDGALFVPLAPVTDFNLVPNTVASVLGLQDNGKQPIVQTIEEFLIDREMLLVLDNFEQVVGASAFVSQLLTNCRKTRIIITSRSALHIRGEYLYNLKPLQLPDTDQQLSVQELLELPSIRLFVQRAGEVNQSLPLNAENV
ncbi:MAG: DUF4062 domain-containing protein, partial [Flavobacteriales bacterium]|nr:DUF4062 domain-containing protein [Flavobacteriales bacterium]